jgi:hypothetical protein
LKGDASTLCGILDQGNFDLNYKAVSKAYEEYVLSEGDFDERIFLGKRFQYLVKLVLAWYAVLPDTFFAMTVFLFTLSR